ncbi:MAG: efflux RND transporter permease subunit, partial [Planctomycetota bacterium]
TLEEGSVEYVVRTLNQFTTLKEIEELPIVTRGPTTIKLKELATVRRSHKDRDVIQRVGGAEAVEVAVYREAGANIVTVAEAARDKVFGPKKPPRGRGGEERRAPTISDKLPEDVQVTLLSDQSTFVSSAIREVNSAALYGGIFAVLVCYFFLRRFATTFIIGLAVPISIVATFGAMYNAGVSLNIMSLGGLALGIGMLVDNAIVVLESITRCREEGDDRMTAAVRGVGEVGGAVVASTLTTIAVFAPIVFVEGIAGQTFGDQALTVVASLTISLAVALFFIPGLAARVNLSEKATPVRDLLASAGQLLPFLRSGKVLRGLGLPRRWWLWAIALVLAAAGGALMGTIPAMDDEWLGPGVEAQGDWSPVPAEVQRRMAALDFAAKALMLPLLWFLALPLLTILARLAYDLVSVSLYALRAVFGGLMVVVWALLWLPTMGFQMVFRGLERVYPLVLRGALKTAPLVLLVALGAGFLVFRGTGDMGRELLPEVLQGELAVATVSSGADRETVSTEESGPHTAVLSLRLDTAREDAHGLEVGIEEELRAMLQREPELARYEIRRPTLLALNAPLEVEVVGDDLVLIGEVAREVEARLRGLEGLNDVRSSLRRGNPEVRITLDRDQLARHGLTAQQVANRLRLAVEGETGSTFPGRDERIDIRVRADFATMEHIEQLRAIPVNPDAERPLPLGAVADFRLEDGPSDIRHIGSRRAAVLSASLAGFDLGATSEAVAAELATLPRPSGVTLSLGGQTDEMSQALDSLSFALLLAIFLVYAVMAAQFESLVQPFLILFSVPLAAVGAILAMKATGTPLSVVALLGAVILAGIVVNNAIVLVDRINRNRADGMEVKEAILEGGRARLRPILMTTTTTVLGMLPMTGWIPFLGGEQGSELRTPMALVVIAGLISSTVLTLVVIPAGYRLLSYLERRPAASHG